MSEEQSLDPGVMVCGRWLRPVLREAERDSVWEVVGLTSDGCRVTEADMDHVGGSLCREVAFGNLAVQRETLGKRFRWHFPKERQTAVAVDEFSGLGPLSSWFMKF